MGGKPRTRLPGARPDSGPREREPMYTLWTSDSSRRKYVLWARPRGAGPEAWPRRKRAPMADDKMRTFAILDFEWAVLHADGSGWTYPPVSTGDSYQVAAEQVEALIEDFYSAVAGPFPFEFQMFEVLLPSES